MENFELNYSLKRSKRKTLGIEVNHKGEVIVTAPDYIPMDKIEEVIQKRRSWILEKVKEKEKNLQIQPKRKYLSGESVYLFGRQYYLKVIKSNDYYVEMAHNRINFYVRDLDEAEAKVTEYLDNEFRSLIAYKTAECLETFQDRYSIPLVPEFKIRKMAKRWGSCTKDGVINLNPTLVAASVECIEYVIFHELTHLLHHDHDEEFFRTLKSVCPKYKELKEKLEKETVLFED
ncbi:PF01863 family protein [Bacteriovorax sp. BSW11_IV]|uniref:M48 family metallopeptidase n=1 Tax=Bacteriovorax sp. BSW11_IV TaxID=1353529 RepID=UPI00038A4C2D|nr:SprT family zinc-dependent metalloprotease [Bacteriovorax sp. BSW11_IV]EQC45181.1 PF01863 family protein [Bacteriovorax sp. BSW11_IV]